MLLTESTETSTKWLDNVAKHHKYFVKVVEGFGERFYAEDIVQEMYLRLYKYTTWDKIVKDGEVNKGFIWFVLRNIYVDFCKQKSRIDKVDLNEAIYINEEAAERTEFVAKNELYLKIDAEIESWHWYDTMLFKQCYPFVFLLNINVSPFNVPFWNSRGKRSRGKIKIFVTGFVKNWHHFL